MLKLSKLEVFAVVAEEGSFTGAAQRLHSSQPAISRHIQELENVLGIRLFKRLRRGVALTKGGEILRDYTHKILWLVHEAEGALTDVRQLAVGQVRVDTTPGVSDYLMPCWTRSFTSHYQNLTVSLRTNTTDGVSEELLNGRADLGIVEGEISERYAARLKTLELQQIEQVLVVGREHPWWNSSHPIDCGQLNEHPFVVRQPGSQTRLWLDGVLHARSIDPRLVAEFDSPEAMKRAVIDGVGVAVLPTYAIAHELAAGILRAVPIQNLSLYRQLKILWNTDRPFSPVTRAFLGHLGKMYKSLEPLVNQITNDVLDI
jgi:DNA-binding transcriptional LysR family regulator